MHWCVVSFIRFQIYLNVKSGQVYQTLIQEREAKGIKDVVISRIEQISPFPYDLVSQNFVQLFTMSY